MLSQPATKVFLRTSEPRAAEWISKALGEIEFERLRETVNYDRHPLYLLPQGPWILSRSSDEAVGPPIGDRGAEQPDRLPEVRELRRQVQIRTESRSEEAATRCCHGR